MIDTDGFRMGVGMIVCNSQGEVLWTRRIRQSVWQFPQGGIEDGEPPEAAVYRELFEEVGLTENDVKILGSTQDWLYYRYPLHIQRTFIEPFSTGQKQKWFLLHLSNEKAIIRLDATPFPEMDKWRWVNYWLPIKQAIDFKRHVYRRALEELVHALPATQHLALKSMQEQSILDES